MRELERGCRNKKYERETEREKESHPDPPHSVSKLGIELKIVIWSDSSSVRFLVKNLVLCT